MNTTTNLTIERRLAAFRATAEPTSEKLATRQAVEVVRVYNQQQAQAGAKKA